MAPDDELFWSVRRFCVSPARPRMGLVINLCQMLKIKMRVDLGGCKIRMPQEFLNRTQVAAGLQQVAGERMT